MDQTTDTNKSIASRARRASLTVFSANPQLGVWQAAGTAIAHAPTLTELRDTESGGDKIVFNTQGQSARLSTVHERNGRTAILEKNVAKSNPGHIRSESSRTINTPDSVANVTTVIRSQHQPPDKQNLRRKHHAEWEQAKYLPTILHGLKAFWKFFTTPLGFVITIYCLNIVAWGAMLFFLLLKAAPAMNHPSADDDNSPRKKWIEIDSQILNGLFCVTGFGLAPWRFRDLYWFTHAIYFRTSIYMRNLAKQNKSWFRPPAWTTEDGEPTTSAIGTFTGQTAPPTPVWKLGFTIWMMVLNTLLQVVLCYYMWHYNRIDRPTWATGTFIGLGCSVAMFAGLVSWWEGRKVKRIEGPGVKVILV